MKKIRESDTETDRESSAPSENESEATPVVEERTRSRKIGRKSVMKTPVLRAQPSDVIQNETLTLSASFSKSGALTGSGLHKPISTEDHVKVSKENMV